jgi:hypothetical protein
MSAPGQNASGRIRRFALLPALLLPALLLPALLLFGCAGAATRPASIAPCRPRCQAATGCPELDAELVSARRPLLLCVGEEARRGHLAAAHRCYRALRFLESARWWLRTLLGSDEMSTVYQPAESVRVEFLCRIELLVRARTAAEVERLYLDTIRAFP